MKRVIVGLVVVALGLTIGAPVVESRAWDPENPPVWVPVTAVTSRPSGDDGGWQDLERAPACVYAPLGFQILYGPILIRLIFDVILPIQPQELIPLEGGDAKPAGNSSGH